MIIHVQPLQFSALSRLIIDLRHFNIMMLNIPIAFLVKCVLVKNGRSEISGVYKPRTFQKTTTVIKSSRITVLYG